MDTPRGHLQFAFACTETMTAHVCEKTLSFADAIQNLESLGMVLNEEETGKRFVFFFFF